MSIFDNPMMSPENLFTLSGNMFAAPNFGAGLGAGLQQIGQNFAAQREKMETQQVENKTRSFVQQAFPDVDVANMPPPVLKLYAEQAIKQRFAPKNDFQFIQAGDRVLLGDKNAGTIKELGDYSKPDLPPIAKEYNWFKETGQFTGGPQEFMAWKSNLSKSGLVVEQTADGFRVVQGDANSVNKITEGQSKDISWLTRGKGANDELKQLDAKLTSLSENTASKLGTPGNYFKSEDYQVAERAGKEFLAVVLRKDSGGAITKDEWDTYGPTFLPQPGDGPQVIQRKRLARERFLEAMNAGLPDGLQKRVPDPATTATSPANADQTATQPKTITLPDGTQGTIRRTR